MAELADNALDAVARDAAPSSITLVDEAHRGTVIDWFRSDAVKVDAVDVVLAAASDVLATLRGRAGTRDVAHLLVAVIASLLSGRLRGYPYVKAVPRTESSPCGVARTSVPHVPRAPGKQFVPCPPHSTDRLAQAQEYVLTA